MRSQHRAIGFNGNGGVCLNGRWYVSTSIRAEYDALEAAMKLRFRQPVAGVVVALNVISIAGLSTIVSATSMDCTLNVSASNTTVTSTSGSDVICVTGSNNVINAGAGNDTIIVSGSDNTINGGDGIDTIDASNASGPTVENGGAGNDILTGSPSSDTLNGGTDDDALIGGAANDTMNGSAGNDNLQGAAGADNISGSTGNDTLTGSTGNDILNGGDGTDTINGGEGDDTVNPGTGNDYVEGGPGADRLFGGDGSDALNGEGGNDWIDGEGGDDTVNSGTGNDYVEGGPGADRLFGGDGSDALNGEGGDDWLSGDGGVDNSNGGNGIDYCSNDPTDTSLSCFFDSAAPRLVSVAVTPASINTGLGPQTVTVRARVSDVGSGARYFGLRFSGPAGVIIDGSWYDTSQPSCPNVSSGSGCRVSGTALDGVYEFKLVVPRYTRAGTYKLSWFYGSDLAENQASESDTSLASRNLAVSFRQVDSGDASAPRLVSVAVTPASINTGLGPQTVTVRARVSDVGSGARYFGLRFSGPAGVIIDGSWYDTSQPSCPNVSSGSGCRVSGTALDGVYEFKLVVPRYTRAGTYKLSWFYGSDLAENQASESDTSLASRNLAVSFQNG